MKDAKITKVLVRKTAHLYKHLNITENYVTNGAWLLDKKSLSSQQQEQFSTVDSTRDLGYSAEGFDESNIQRVIGKIKEEYSWTVSCWSYLTEGTISKLVRFLMPDHADNNAIAVQDNILTLLGFEVGDILWAENEISALVGGKDSIKRILMPINIDPTKFPSKDLGKLIKIGRVKK